MVVVAVTLAPCCGFLGSGFGSGADPGADRSCGRRAGPVPAVACPELQGVSLSNTVYFLPSGALGGPRPRCRRLGTATWPTLGSTHQFAGAGSSRAPRRGKTQSHFVTSAQARTGGEWPSGGVRYVVDPLPRTSAVEGASDVCAHYRGGPRSRPGARGG